MSRFSPVSVVCCLLLGFAVGLGSLKASYNNMSWRDIGASIVLGEQSPEERWALLEGKLTEGLSSVKDRVTGFVDGDIYALHKGLYGLHPDFDMTSVSGEQAFSISAPTIFSMIPLVPQEYTGFTLNVNSTYSADTPNWYRQKMKQDMNVSLVLDETDTLDIGGQMVIDASDIFMKLNAFEVSGFENMPEVGLATASVADVLGSWIQVNVEQEDILEHAEMVLTMQQLMTKMEKHFELSDMIKMPTGKKDGEWYVYSIELNDEQFKTSLEAFVTEAEAELAAMGMTTDIAREAITEAWDGFSAFYQQGALASHADNLDHWKAQLILGPDKVNSVAFIFESNTDYMALSATDIGGELFSFVLEGDTFTGSIPEEDFVITGEMTDTQISGTIESKKAYHTSLECATSEDENGALKSLSDCTEELGKPRHTGSFSMERENKEAFWNKGTLVFSELKTDVDTKEEVHSVEQLNLEWDVTDEAFKASLVVPQTTFDEEWNLVETIATYSLSGTHSDSGMAGGLSMDGEQMLNFAFEKDAEGMYSGSIQVPSLAMELVVEQYKSNSTADQYDTEGVMKLLMGGQSLIDMSFSGTMHSVDSVNIQVPVEYKTLEELMGGFYESAEEEAYFVSDEVLGDVSEVKAEAETFSVEASDYNKATWENMASLADAVEQKDSYVFSQDAEVPVYVDIENGSLHAITPLFSGVSSVEVGTRESTSTSINSEQNTAFIEWFGATKKDGSVVDSGVDPFFANNYQTVRLDEDTNTLYTHVESEGISFGEVSLSDMLENGTVQDLNGVLYFVEQIEEEADQYTLQYGQDVTTPFGYFKFEGVDLEEDELLLAVSTTENPYFTITVKDLVTNEQSTDTTQFNFTDEDPDSGLVIEDVSLWFLDTEGVEDPESRYEVTIEMPKNYTRKVKHVPFSIDVSGYVPQTQEETEVVGFQDIYDVTESTSDWETYVAQYDMVFYYGKECSHCQNLIAFLPEVQELYPAISIKGFEVWNNPLNMEMANAHAEALGQEITGVPTVVVGDQLISGAGEEQLLELLAETGIE